jgi:hypothetical protein
MSVPAKPPISRVLGRYTVTETGCWNFDGYINAAGYGHTWNAATNSPALTHRVMYEHIIGAIPDGLHIDHLCRNRACCNPSHLEPVPPRINLCRGVGWAGRNAQATQCVNGHQFDDWNTVYRPEGGRTCRTCRNARARRYASARRLVEPTAAKAS